MEGLTCSRDDILDLIEEICRLREYASLPPLKAIPSPVQPEVRWLRQESALPWDDEFPGNP